MILAIDPGYSNYGYAVYNKKGKITAVGVLKTEASKRKITRVSDDTANRITSLTVQLVSVIKTHQIRGVVGELPVLGGQNARAVAQMAIAAAVSVCTFTIGKLPVEWVTPMEVKLAITGSKQATKELMMETVCKDNQWKITTKNFYTKKTKKLKRIDKIYHPLDEAMGKNRFEHIADAIGAFEASKQGNLVRMYIS